MGPRRRAERAAGREVGLRRCVVGVPTGRRHRVDDEDAVGGEPVPEQPEQLLTLAVGHPVDDAAEDDAAEGGWLDGT